MKSSLYKYASYLLIVVFFIYWILIAILSTPPNRIKIAFEKELPAFYNLFPYNWKFFSPPFTYNDRMYLVLRNRLTHTETDTIELLKKIALQKQQKPSFDQTASITDRVVNYYVSKVKAASYMHLIKLKKDSLNATDSFYMAKSSEETESDPGCAYELLTLENYCKQQIKQANIDTTGKEFKVIILEEAIRPFDKRLDENFIPDKKIAFETNYNSFGK